MSADSATAFIYNPQEKDIYGFLKSMLFGSMKCSNKQYPFYRKILKGTNFHFFMTYEFLEHMADVKFRATAPSLEELFVEASKALNEEIRGELLIAEEHRKELNVEAQDLPGLLYNFLEEFLFLLDAQDFLVARVSDLVIDEAACTLSCMVHGDEAEQYTFTNDVKAITFNDLYVRKEHSGDYACQVVLDV